MLLSMWMISSELESYEPEINISDGTKRIRTARLLKTDQALLDDIIYIGTAKDPENPEIPLTVCQAGEDTLILHTDDVIDVFN